MEQYLFLFAVAFVWIVFAVIQDMRTREVANWLNFSLIGIVLAYRAFYAVVFEDILFFVYGLIGVLFFVGLAYAFYYGRVFAGGDAKLLMGLGGILPFSSFNDVWLVGLGFILVLFSAGAVYTLVYSLFLVLRNRSAFRKSFAALFGRYKMLLITLFVAGVVIGIVLFFNGLRGYWLLYGMVFAVLLVLFIYVKAVEQSCMISRVPASRLREGDWLEKSIRVGKHIIQPSVHGLSAEDIRRLRAARKQAWIKDGVPFTPAFLLAFIALLLWYLRTGF